MITVYTTSQFRAGNVMKQLTVKLRQFTVGNKTEAECLKEAEKFIAIYKLKNGIK